MTDDTTQDATIEGVETQGEADEFEGLTIEDLGLPLAPIHSPNARRTDDLPDGFVAFEPMLGLDPDEEPAVMGRIVIDGKRRDFVITDSAARILAYAMGRAMAYTMAARDEPEPDSPAPAVFGEDDSW